MSVPGKLFSNSLCDGLSKKFILLKIQLLIREYKDR